MAGVLALGSPAVCLVVFAEESAEEGGLVEAYGRRLRPGVFTFAH